MVTHQGEDQPFVRNVMTLKSCSPIVGVEVMSFDAERDILLAWRVCVACCLWSYQIQLNVLYGCILPLSSLENEFIAPLSMVFSSFASNGFILFAFCIHILNLFTLLLAICG